MRSSVEQLVTEIRTCAAAARRSAGGGRGRVGVLGLSLGALGAALAATSPDPLDFAALVAPPHLPSVMSETGVGRRYRRLSERAGGEWPTEPALARALSPLDPAARRPTARSLFLAAGVHDAIAPLPGAIRLAGSWGITPRLHARGHLTLLFACRALRREVRAFLEGSTGVAAAPGAERVESEGVPCEIGGSGRDQP
jgi:hypothetical protein